MQMGCAPCLHVPYYHALFDRSAPPAEKARPWSAQPRLDLAEGWWEITDGDAGRWLAFDPEAVAEILSRLRPNIAHQLVFRGPAVSPFRGDLPVLERWIVVRSQSGRVLTTRVDKPRAARGGKQR